MGDARPEHGGLVNLEEHGGVKLLGEGEITSSVHIEVARVGVGDKARRAGGTEELAHYNRPPARSLKPHKLDKCRGARGRRRLLLALVPTRSAAGARPSCSCGTGGSACGGGRGTRQGDER